VCRIRWFLAVLRSFWTKYYTVWNLKMSNSCTLFVRLCTYIFTHYYWSY
jgi:hypothetical protein